MDDTTLDAAEHEHALRALCRVNRQLGVDRQLSSSVSEIMATDEGSVLDLGAGGGEFLGALSDRKVGNTHIGLDVSLRALQMASGWYPHVLHWLCADARTLPLTDGSIDLVTCSLFLHHFDEEDVCTILCEAARVARKGVVFADLTRSRTAYWLTWLFTRVTSRSHVFHVDGPRSVRAAYTPEELRRIVQHAGLDGAKIRTRFPFRMILSWRK
jgi:ubiquinone/menaquinone biosynthesis C-methylase UbiE